MSDVNAAGTSSFLQTFTDVLSQVLGEIAGSALPLPLSLDPVPGFPPSTDADLWITAVCSGGLRGEMTFRIPPASGVRLAQIFMSEPASDAQLSAEHRDAVLELMRQAHGLFATAIKSSWGEVQIQVDLSPASPSWPASSSAWLQSATDSSRLWIEAQLSAALVAGLRADKEPAPSAPPPLAAAAPTPDNGSLQLLMDVELSVALRFGSRRLLLRELLDLSPGAVVELDRQVQDPVDMLLDGRVVARGEIVVVDGNYGLRVTEVAPGAQEYGNR